MRFFANAINNKFHGDIITEIDNPNVLSHITEVKAAVAYASKMPSLFTFCEKKEIPLEFYCRYDNNVPVAPSILKWFLGKKSKGMECKLAGDYFHAKVIWIVGHGVYIGSANLTDRAWNNNIEAGVFFSEDEMYSCDIYEQVENFFETLDAQSFALSAEIVEEQEKRLERYKGIQEQINKFENKENENRILIPFENLINKQSSASDKDNRKFIQEWQETVEILREIAQDVSTQYRPTWVKDTVPIGSQADQFLHAYYDETVKEGRGSRHHELHEINRTRIKQALQEQMSWWQKLPEAPSTEERQFYDWGPKLLKLVHPNKILSLSEEEFADLCCMIHAFANHSRQMRYATLGINYQDSGVEKVRAGARWVYRQRSKDNKTVLELINYLLYSNDENMTSRIWKVCYHYEWRIPHFGLSTVGELVGSALPNEYCPRNQRTNKALYALGYNVRLFQ